MSSGEESDLIYDWAEAGPRNPHYPGHVMLDDETLRDGLQSPSVTDPPLETKVEILHLMESLGIETADVGLPGAGPAPARSGAAVVPRDFRAAAEYPSQLRCANSDGGHSTNCRGHATHRSAY